MNLFCTKEYVFDNVPLNCRKLTKNIKYCGQLINLLRRPRKIFINYIPKTISKQDIHDTFSQYGEIEEQTFITKENYNHNFSFVTFESHKSAKKCIQSTKFQDSSKLDYKVNYAKPKVSTKLLKNIEHDSIRDYISVLINEKRELCPDEFNRIYEEVCGKDVENSQDETKMDNSSFEQKDPVEDTFKKKAMYVDKNFNDKGLFHDNNFVAGQQQNGSNLKKNKLHKESNKKTEKIMENQNECQYYLLKTENLNGKTAECDNNKYQKKHPKNKDFLQWQRDVNEFKKASTVQLEPNVFRDTGNQNNKNKMPSPNYEYYMSQSKDNTLSDAILSGSNNQPTRSYSTLKQKMRHNANEYQPITSLYPVEEFDYQQSYNNSNQNLQGNSCCYTQPIQNYSNLDYYTHSAEQTLDQDQYQRNYYDAYPNYSTNQISENSTAYNYAPQTYNTNYAPINTATNQFSNLDQYDSTSNYLANQNNHPSYYGYYNNQDDNNKLNNLPERNEQIIQNTNYNNYNYGNQNFIEQNIMINNTQHFANYTSDPQVNDLINNSNFDYRNFEENSKNDCNKDAQNCYNQTYSSCTSQKNVNSVLNKEHHPMYKTFEQQSQSNQEKIREGK